MTPEEHAPACAVTTGMRLLISCCLLGGCAVAGAATELVFDNPPVVGSLLATDRHDVRCESRAGARYTAETGFFHADCSALSDTEQVEWRVIEREYEELDEGGLWMLRSLHLNGDQTWLVLPWHDWV